MVPEDRDKPTVIALREIAEGLVTPNILEEEEIDLEKELFGESEEIQTEAETETKRSESERRYRSQRVQCGRQRYR